MATQGMYQAVVPIYCFGIGPQRCEVPLVEIQTYLELSKRTRELFDMPEEYFDLRFEIMRPGVNIPLNVGAWDRGSYISQICSSGLTLQANFVMRSLATSADNPFGDTNALLEMVRSASDETDVTVTSPPATSGRQSSEPRDLLPGLGRTQTPPVQQHQRSSPISHHSHGSSSANITVSRLGSGRVPSRGSGHGSSPPDVTVSRLGQASAHGTGHGSATGSQGSVRSIPTSEVQRVSISTRTPGTEQLTPYSVIPSITQRERNERIASLKQFETYNRLPRPIPEELVPYLDPVQAAQSARDSDPDATPTRPRHEQSMILAASSTTESPSAPSRLQRILTTPGLGPIGIPNAPLHFVGPATDRGANTLAIPLHFYICPQPSQPDLRTEILPSFTSWCPLTSPAATLTAQASDHVVNCGSMCPAPVKSADGTQIIKTYKTWIQVHLELNGLSTHLTNNNRDRVLQRSLWVCFDELMNGEIVSLTLEEVLMVLRQGHVGCAVYVMYLEDGPEARKGMLSLPWEMVITD